MTYREITIASWVLMAVAAPFAILCDEKTMIAVAAMLIAAYACLYVIWRRSTARRFRLLDSMQPGDVRAHVREGWPL